MLKATVLICLFLALSCKSAEKRSVQGGSPKAPIPAPAVHTEPPALPDIPLQTFQITKMSNGNLLEYMFLGDCQSKSTKSDTAKTRTTRASDLAQPSLAPGACEIDIRECVQKESCSDWSQTKFTQMPTPEESRPLMDLFQKQDAYEQELQDIANRVNSNLIEAAPLFDQCLTTMKNPDDLATLKALAEISPADLDRIFKYDFSEQANEVLKEADATNAASPSDVTDLQNSVSDLDKTIASQNHVQEMIGIVSIPILIGGLISVGFQSLEITGWFKYVKRQRTINFGTKDHPQYEQLVRHKSGFLVRPDDKEKDLKDLRHRVYMDDPISMRMIGQYENDIFKPTPMTDFADLVLAADPSIYYSARRWYNGSEKLYFKRDDDGKLITKDGRITFDETLYRETKSDDIYDKKKVPSLKNLSATEKSRLIADMKVRTQASFKNKYDPSEGGKFNSSYGEKARAFNMSISLLATGVGIAGVIVSLNLAGSDDQCATLKKNLDSIVKDVKDAKPIKDQLFQVKTDIHDLL